MDKLYATVAEALRAGRRLALVTIVSVEGSTPRSAGAQMLVWEDGHTEGTVGGGSLEAHITRDALAALTTGESVLRDYSLHAGEPGSLGVCGGQVQAFIHVLAAPETVLIVGAGHVAQPLAQLAHRAGFGVLVVDDRPEFLGAERFPEVETRAVSFADLPSQVVLDEHTFVVIVTRSHEHDEVALRQVLGRPVAYLGVMGSRAKVRRLFERLRHEGHDPQELERVHAPIGLDIGAETPAELAVSIVAELIQARRGGTGLPLSQVRRRPPQGAGGPGGGDA